MVMLGSMRCSLLLLVVLLLALVPGSYEFEVEIDELPCRDDVSRVYREMSNLENFNVAKSLTERGFHAYGEATLEKRHEGIGLLQKAVCVSVFAFDARHKLAMIHHFRGSRDRAYKLWNTSIEVLATLHAVNGYDYPWDQLVQEESTFKHGTTTFTQGHKLRHDAEYLEYLHSIGIYTKLTPSPEAYDALIRQYLNLSVELQEAKPMAMKYGNEHGYISLTTNALRDVLGDFWGRLWIRGADVNVPQLQPGPQAVKKPTKKEMKAYLKTFTRDRIVVVDNVFTPEVLEMLFETCLRTPMFMEVKPWGYLGAYPSTGLTLSHPAFLQIADELPEMFKELFDFFVIGSDDVSAGRTTNSSRTKKKASKRKSKTSSKKSKASKKKGKSSEFSSKKKKNTKKKTSGGGSRGRHTELGQVWLYKYDNTEMKVDHSGIGVHADGALVNINIWLTPDEVRKRYRSVCKAFIAFINGDLLTCVCVTRLTRSVT
jgi:hypothetical protein